MTAAQDALITALDRLRGAVEDLRDRLDVLGTSSPGGVVDLLGFDEVARALGVSPRTLRRLRTRRGFPRPLPGPGPLRWRRSTVQAYLERGR